MPELAQYMGIVGQSACVGLPASLVYLPMVTLPRVIVGVYFARELMQLFTRKHLEFLRTLNLTTCTLRHSYCGGMNQRLT